MNIVTDGQIESTVMFRARIIIQKNLRNPNITLTHWMPRQYDLICFFKNKMFVRHNDF